MDRSVPSDEVVKAIRSLVISVLGHFGPLKKDRSDLGPKWTPTRERLQNQYGDDTISRCGGGGLPLIVVASPHWHFMQRGKINAKEMKYK